MTTLNKDPSDSHRFGAREVKRIITRHLWNPLCNDWLDEKIQSGEVIEVSVDAEQEEMSWHTRRETELERSPLIPLHFR